MCTAVIASVISGQRQPVAFWAAASVGAVTVVIFSLLRHGGALSVGDILLFAAVVACGLGYAYGGFLSTTMPGWQVIAWGNVVALPVNLLVAGIAMGQEPIHLTTTGLLGLTYVAGVSQFLGFVVWYSGMARMGVAQASQLQLAQPLLTVVWAVLLMGEALDPMILLTAAIVITCIVVTQRAKR